VQIAGVLSRPPPRIIMRRRRIRSGFEPFAAAGRL